MADNESLFDPAAFFQTDIAGSFDTSRPPVPPGEYPASVSKIDLRSGISAKGRPWASLNVIWEIDDETVRQETGLSKPTARQKLFLDLNEAGDGLAIGRGKNVDLGVLREAVGQNFSDRPWNFNMLEGASAIVRTDVETYRDRTYSVVKGVVAL